MQLPLAKALERVYTAHVVKKRQRPAQNLRRIKAIRRAPYPDNDPEWEHLEERYSQIDAGSMRRLAEILTR